MFNAETLAELYLDAGDTMLQRGDSKRRYDFNHCYGKQVLIRTSDVECHCPPGAHTCAHEIMEVAVFCNMNSKYTLQRPENVHFQVQVHSHAHVPLTTHVLCYCRQSDKGRISVFCICESEVPRDLPVRTFGHVHILEVRKFDDEWPYTISRLSFPS
jgi:hypothetical protein